MMKKKILFYLSGLVILSLLITILIYKDLFGVNIKTDKKNQVIYIPSGASYQQVLDTLKSHLVIKSLKVFNWVAIRKNYPVLIKPGKYVIDRDLSYNRLINILRSGRQTPVKITINNVRTLNQLAGKIGPQIEADSLQIMSFLSDDSNFSSDGFTKENIIALFIPNTYQLFWNTDGAGLYSRMLKEYKLFWNDQRMAKANEKGLDPKEVAIL